MFLDLNGRCVALVGAGAVAEAKRQQFAAAGADVRVIAPEAFVPADLDGVWLVVAAAGPEVNSRVADAAAARRLFVNAVDDPPNATAFLGGVVRRDGVTIAISTDGAAPALTGLLREGIDALLPADLSGWMSTARDARVAWKRDRVPIEERKPKLLEALNRRYQ
ncbi:MAG TPA: NAD(P)-dependent oxidoreductase [Vicinamibacterales bacterium]|nr:NAD(P)-dependent oxidoreductase [Vicinamibacterales bacterium]